MKKIFLLSIIATLLLAGFNSCTTYDEGPGFTVLTANARIKGTWKQTELYINDNPQGDTYKIEFTFDSDGTGTRSVNINGSSATYDIDWQLNNDKTVIMFKNNGDDEWSETTIIRLTNKELWIEEISVIFGTMQFRYEKV
ncbi:MAG: lipocalin family protein [Bacteroidales bacterium]|nr:lipocalin family protein [Bacteroidales bacterium]